MGVMSAPVHPPVSAARLLMRRVMVAVVLAVVGYSAVKAMVDYVGGDDEIIVTDPGTADQPAGDGSGAQADVGDESAGLAATGDGASGEIPGEIPGDVSGESGTATVPPVTAPPATAPPVTEPPNTGPPSPSNKAKVYIVGDSDAGTFGPYLQQLLDGTSLAETELNYKVSSGLARPDFYNWPAELEAALPAAAPDIVVATFGGNDSQGLRNLDLSWEVQDPLANRDEWVAEYTRRAGEVMDLLLENDRTLIWVGIPNDDNPEVTARLALQDEAAKAAAAARPEVVFIDTWARFSGRDGNWAEFVIDPRDGQGKDVRAADGFHLNVNGAEILALDIAVAVQDDLRSRGANI